MRKLLFLAALIFCAAHAHATNCALASGASTATVQAALSALSSGSCTGTANGTTVTFASGGAWTITSQLNIPCPSTTAVITGPAIAYPGPGPFTGSGPFLATLNSTVSGGFMMNLPTSTCTTPLTIENLNLNGGNPSPDGGGIIYGTTNGGSNVTITNNYLHGNAADPGTQTSGGGNQYDSLIWLDGSDTPDGGNYWTNVSITWNSFGGSSDCNGIFTLPVSSSSPAPNQFNYQGGGYNSSGGYCAGLGVHSSTSNLIVTNNVFYHQEQFQKFFEGGTAPNTFYLTNATIANNDYSFWHRIGIELQQDTTGNNFSNNDIHNPQIPGFGMFGFSLPSFPTQNANSNLFIADNSAQCCGQGSGSYIAGALEFWGNGSASNNLFQGDWTITTTGGGCTGQCGSGILWGYSGPATFNYNTFQFANNWNFIVQEETGPAPNETGNVTGTAIAAVPSVAPSISPASGPQTFPLAVTLTDNGYGSTSPYPNGNTSIWYTTDGTTPVPGQSAVAPTVYAPNTQNTLTGWDNCIIGSCPSGGTPGGVNAPASTTQTINNASPSLTGASMLVGLTTLTTSTQTNSLWSYKTPSACDSCRYFFLDIYTYPTNLTAASALEYDMVDFDATDGLSLTLGGQCNLGSHLWQISNQTSGWINTSISCSALTSGSFHHLQYAGHASNTTLFYDSVTIDGTVGNINQTLPTTPIPGGFTSGLYYQAQIDVGPTTSAQTVSENLDSANFSASSSPIGSTKLYTGSFNVSATTTVKAVGMWGAANQPTSYPSGYGFAPSSVVSATYTGSSSGSYISPTGNDSNSGTMASPWLTPNHAMTGGQTITALAGTYAASNFTSGKWGTVTPSGSNDIAWINCATFDACKISATSADAMWVDKDYWGVSGFETTTATSGACFRATPSGSYVLHHVVFADDIANGCASGGFMAYNTTTAASVDYIALVGNISYNAAQGSTACYSGISILGPIASDTTAGTHIYVNGNFSYANVNPNPCNGSTPTDGNGIILDNFNGAGPGTPDYAQQAVVENNLSFFNGGNGIEARQNTNGTMQFRLNTSFGNATDTNQTGACSDRGELYGKTVKSTTWFYDLAQTRTGTSCSSAPLYAFGILSGDSTSYIGNSWWSGASSGSGVAAATCSTADVQTAINTATEGQTVTVPSGNCTWTSGVTISGKGITVNGAGSGRAVAYSSSTLSLGTGSKSLTVASTRVDGTYPLGPNTSQTLTVSELGNKQNFMTGTVTSFNSGTGALVMNITSQGGTCGTGSSGGSPSNCARWIVLTECTTCITNNSSSTLFSVTEDSSVHTTLQNFEIDGGTGTGDYIDLISGGGAAVVIQNMRWAMNANADIGLHSGVNRGVVSNVTCDFTPFSQAPICIDPQPFDTTAWQTSSYMGTLDTNGQHNLYVETSDFHACLLCFDNDEGARTVIRYSFFNNAGIGGHGADTGPLGARYNEFYHNVGNFNGYNNGKTFPMNQWDYVRGGTFVYWDNTMPALTSTDYGTKDDINMTVMNLQRDSGTTYTSCWGHNTSTGADYYAPHQVGTGCTTAGCSAGSGGTGLDGKGNNIYSTNPYGYGNQYVGDSDPAYIWGNSRQPLTNVTYSDYGNSNSDSCVTMIGGTTDTSGNYIESGRDYFNGSTAKPGYTAYTYPHPLVTGGGGGTNSTDPGTNPAILGTGNTIGTNPSFSNPVNPGAPSCGSFSSTTACMAAVISDYVPTASGSTQFGYQPPSSTSITDPLFPAWLCNGSSLIAGFPSGLMTPGCGGPYPIPNSGFLGNPGGVNTVAGGSAAIPFTAYVGYSNIAPDWALPDGYGNTVATWALTGTTSCGTINSSGLFTPGHPTSTAVCNVVATCSCSSPATLNQWTMTVNPASSTPAPPQVTVIMVQ